MRIRIVTFNVGLMRIHACGCTLFENPPAVARRAPAVVSRMPSVCLGADVVCVQECYDEEHRRMMRRSMGGHPHVACFTDRTWLNSGLMVFSKHPIERSRRVPHGSCCAYERVFGDRSMLVARIRFPGGRYVNLVNVHLTAGVPPGCKRMSDIRTKQVGDIHDQLKEMPPGEPAIVAGDFNFSPDVTPENYVCMSGLGLRDAWMYSSHPGGSDGKGFTWDTDNPLNAGKTALQDKSHRCDQVWVNGSVRPVSSRVIFGAVSDHYAVAVDAYL